MITIPGIKGKSFGVFGLGATGVTSADALIASGADVYSYDENAEARARVSNTEYRAEHPIHWPWEELSALVLSPGVPLTHPKPHSVVEKAKSCGVEIIGDIELFARAINAIEPSKRPKIVAVTGSNGKSTTTALIAHILRETGHRVFEGGNIGQAVLTLEEPQAETYYVLELSSYQLDLVKSLHSTIAVFLNVSPDHLDRHGGMDGYVAAKRRIFRNQTENDYAIIGVDDPVSQTVCTDLTAKQKSDVIPVSAMGTLGHGVFVLNGELFYNFDHKTSEAGSIPDIAPLKGQHNHQNASAAFAVCNRLGVSPPLIMLAMAKFTGLPHRMEKITQIDGVTFINDSKATNAEASVQALASFQNIYWLAGGKAKEGGIEAIVKSLSNVRKAYLFGESGSLFKDQIDKRVKSGVFRTLEDAIGHAYNDALNSDVSNPVVLLSPAAASFDQYQNFEARGEAFRQMVEQLSLRGGEAA